MPLGGYSLVQWGAFVIFLAFVIGVAIAVIRYYQIPVPPIIWQILGFGLVAILALVVLFAVAKFAFGAGDGARARDGAGRIRVNPNGNRNINLNGSPNEVRRIRVRMAG